MAMWRKDKGEARSPKAVLAAAMPLVGPDVRRVSNLRRKQTVEGWQADAWYFYDAIGELRSPINWISNAVSQANPFAAETDPGTGLVTGPTDDARVQRVASLLLGGAAKRAQLQYILAVCWQIPGEAFIVIRPKGQGQPDEWLILAGDRVTAKGASWEYTDPATLLPVQLGSRDRLIRVWSPHPRDQAMADSAIRPALPILREVERASMNIAARLDSRLAGNGILAFPQEVNFPTADGQSVGASVTEYLLEAASQALSNPGTASAQVPIVLEMPSELIDAFTKGHLDLSTDFDGQIVDLRKDGLDRLAATLDMPREVAKGTQGEANHWSAWQVEESTYKIYIEPLLQRIGDALTEYWFRPALAAMGIQNPDGYVIEWDTSEIVARPDSTEDTNWLYEHELISDDARRARSGVPDDDIPRDDEVATRRLFELAKLDPTLLEVPEYADMLGLPQRPPAQPTSVPALPASTDANGDTSRRLPATQENVPDGLVAAATFVVFDALSRAGGRLLTREHRGQFGSTPKQDLYLRIPFEPTDVDRLMEGSFQSTDGLAEGFGLDPEAFGHALRAYTASRLRNKAEHDPSMLKQWLRTAQ